VRCDLDGLAGDVTVIGISGGVLARRRCFGDFSFSAVKGTLDAGTGAGAVSIKSQGGDVRVGTGSGDVNIGGADGKVSVKTGSGDIVIGGVVGSVKASTGSGDVEVRDSKGEVQIDTGSGDALIKNVMGSEVRVETGSGSIRIESPALFNSPHRVRVRLHTGCGDIFLAVDAQASMLSDFSSVSGKVKIPCALERSMQLSGDRGNYRCKMGAGENQVRVDTGSGDLVFRLAGD
jgi:DUF4097 and DUF4098 domain-containing protein YvlB